MLNATKRELDFGRSLVDCINNMSDLEKNGIRFIAVTEARIPIRGTPPPDSDCTSSAAGQI
jgi:hypothetical protein